MILRTVRARRKPHRGRGRSSSSVGAEGGEGVERVGIREGGVELLEMSEQFFDDLGRGVDPHV